MMCKVNLYRVMFECQDEFPKVWSSEFHLATFLVGNSENFPYQIERFFIQQGGEPRFRHVMSCHTSCRVIQM